MNLTKYRPNDLISWDFGRLFDNFFSDDLWNLDSRYPAVDVKEDTDKYVLEAEIPGLTEKDIKVEVNDNLLTISSKKEETKEEKKDGYLIRERKNFAFSRTFSLPKDVNRDKIDASFKNGLLRLILTKTPESKPKEIEVKNN